MEKRYTEDKEEIEIDLRELLFELKKRLWLILVALFLGIGIAGAGSAFLITPQYKSEAKLYILSKETTLTSLADAFLTHLFCFLSLFLLHGIYGR